MIGTSPLRTLRASRKHEMVQQSTHPLSSVSAAPVVVNLAVYAMGTRFELALAGERESHVRAVGEAALDEIRYLHEKFSYFSGASIVSHINRNAADRAVDLDRETFDVLSLCCDVWDESGGAFDITIAPLMHAYGFRGLSRRTSAENTETEGGRAPAEFMKRANPAEPPSRSSRCDFDAPAAKTFGTEHLQLVRESRTIRYSQSGMAIDLGAVAKGYALDRAAAICREHGITCGLLHGGTSTVIALGAPPDEERGWGIRIHDDAEPLIVYLRDEALSVSAPRGRTVKSDGTTRGHIIDPRSGMPAAGITTAAVIGPDATLADAWSTALLVLQTRPADLPDSYTTLIRSVDDGWTCNPAGCRHAAIELN